MTIKIFAMNNQKKSNYIFLTIITSFVVAICAAGFFFPETKEDIRITEICCNNSICAYDDYGDYGHDYIELYNNTDRDINLSGFGLTDDSKDPYKFLFGDYIIKARDTFIVWCGGDNGDSKLFNATYFPKCLHQNEFAIKDGDPVDKATVVKAMAVKGDKTSCVASRTYFIGLSNQPEYEGYSVMEITMAPQDLFGYENGIYCTGKVQDACLEKFDESLINEAHIYKYANYAKEGKGWERRAKKSKD